MSGSRKKRLKPKIEELFKEKLYEKRDEKFQKYYHANKNNFYEKDSYKFQFLYIPIDTTDINITSTDAKNYYQQYKNELRVPSKIKLNTIFLPNEEAEKNGGDKICSASRCKYRFSHKFVFIRK